MKIIFSLCVMIFLSIFISCAQTIYKSDTLTVKNGVYKDYYKSKNIKIISNYKNNMLHGEYKTFYEDGIIESSCYFIDGKKDGKWKSYYPNGKLKSVTILNGDSVIWSSKCDENGEMKMVQIYVDGISKYEFFYDKGLIITEGKSNYSILPQDNINQQVDKIIIRNKTENDLIKSECILTDSISINKFLSELNELKPISNAKTNISSGFYEILFLFKEAEINELRVIYTRYDGVVIKAKGSLYKNDRMESLALYYLQQKIDCK